MSLQTIPGIVQEILAATLCIVTPETSSYTCAIISPSVPKPNPVPTERRIPETENEIRDNCQSNSQNWELVS